MQRIRALSIVLMIGVLAVFGCSSTTDPSAELVVPPSDGARSSSARHAMASLETIATNLDNPRGLAFAPNGALYVMEAGVGGDGPCFEGPEGQSCYGLSGAISRVWRGRQERIVSALPSIAAPDGSGAIGPHGVAVNGVGNVLVTLGLGADPAIREEGGALGGLDTQLGYLIKVTGSGHVQPLVDVSAFEGIENPDGGEIDSNPFGVVAVGNRRFVADAGANAVLAIGADGSVSTLASFPDRLVLAPPELGLPEGTEIPMQSVPTSVAIGPDGALYVGELTGFPFPVGAARVYRIGFAGNVEIFAEDLTNVIGIAFSPAGDLLALEIATNSLFSGDPTGALVRVAGGTREAIASDGLILPGGLAIGPDGAAYVTNCGVCPGGGTVERIQLP